MTDVTPTPEATSPVPPPPPAAAAVAPGWLVEPGTGATRWWDGQAWGAYQQQAPAQSNHGPLTSKNLKVKQEVSYVRQQKGHSIILHLFLGMFVLWINVLYISVSPNHYWHA